MIYFKKHQRTYGARVAVVIAMCDADLIGKKLKSGNGALLDLATYGGFYRGEEVSEKKAGEILAAYFANREGVSFNLVGSECMKAASKYIDVSKAKKFGKVPHLQIYRV